MSLQVLLSIFAVALLFSGVKSKLRNTLWIQQPSKTDLIFDENLIWIVASNSMTECANMCAMDMNCASFTFTKMSSDPVTCRGHSQTVTSTGIRSPTTMLYYKDTDFTWLTSPCANNADCSETNAECFAGECLCTPGYFYSVSLQTCNAGCADLQQSFVIYRNSRLVHNNFASGTVTSLLECQDHCLTLPNCVTLDYRWASTTCHFASVTVLDIPSAWQQSVASHHHSQRTCA